MLSEKAKARGSSEEEGVSLVWDGDMFLGHGAKSTRVS